MLFPTSDPELRSTFSKATNKTSIHVKKNVKPHIASIVKNEYKSVPV